LERLGQEVLGGLVDLVLVGLVALDWRGPEVPQGLVDLHCHGRRVLERLANLQRQGLAVLVDQPVLGGLLDLDCHGLRLLEGLVDLHGQGQERPGGLQGLANLEQVAALAAALAAPLDMQ